MERPWDRLIPDHEKAVYQAAGYFKRGQWGARPALLIVDVNYNFTGDRPEPILESIKRFRTSCGEIAWRTLPRIATLLEAARAHDVPVFYTTSGYRPTVAGAGSWAQKSSRAAAPTDDELRLGPEIVKEIAPLPDEIVIRKDKPSAFFGTPLVSHLVLRGVDTVVIAGTVTSGCVRASAVDAFSHNYRVVVVEDCVFDRVETTHLINLFDLDAKYADVVPAREVIAYFERLRAS